jgi:hypothetical protein
VTAAAASSPRPPPVPILAAVPVGRRFLPCPFSSSTSPTCACPSSAARPRSDRRPSVVRGLVRPRPVVRGRPRSASSRPARLLPSHPEENGDRDRAALSTIPPGSAPDRPPAAVPGACYRPRPPAGPRPVALLVLQNYPEALPSPRRISAAATTFYIVRYVPVVSGFWSFLPYDF